MAKLLWISDAGRPTGFGTVTHALGERLVEMGHDIHVLAVGWDAKYHVPGPLKLYRAEAGPFKSYLGMDRVAEMIKLVEPDLVMLNEDPPMVYRRLLENTYDQNKTLLKNQPVIAYMPVDFYDIPEQWVNLKNLVKVIPYTRFGADAFGLNYWVHHAVESAFRPLPEDERREIRRSFDIDDDAFVIGRVDTNTGRKDWGSTWKAIDLALQKGLDESKTVALFHTKLHEPRSGINLGTVISRGRGQWKVTNETGWPVEDLVKFYNAMDVFISTSRGEGWGLTMAEALACGVPVVATNCSSIPEVTGPGALLFDPVASMTNPYGVDLKLADVDAMADALVYLHDNPDHRRELGQKGREHVGQFSWDFSAEMMRQYIEGRLAE